MRAFVVVFACVTFAANAAAQEAPIVTHAAPSPLLQIDQHRQSVVDGIVSIWQEALLAKHGVNAAKAQAELRATLMGLRADRLLAASLAGSYATMEVLVAETRAEDRGAARSMLKALGDANADLTYTPVNPCRIVDTRAAGGALVANTARTFDGYSSSTFAAQGGAASNCGMPSGAAAVAMNVYAVNPTNLGFIKVWGANGAEPAVSTVNYQVGITAIATGAIVPVDSANSNRFIAKSPAGVDFIADVVGYFRAPGSGTFFAQGGNSLGTTATLGTKDANALEILVGNLRAMRYEPSGISPNVIGGHSGNGVLAGVRGATIGGGGNAAAGDPDFGSEAPNRVTDHYGFVGGGYANQAGDAAGSLLDAPYAVVVGGRQNVASGEAASIVGGRLGLAAGDFSAVGGGIDNSALGHFSVVAGGYSNSAGITGGAAYAVAGGGFDNTASGDLSAILGGSNNVANGQYGVIPGGEFNLAQGSHSFAAGNHARANFSGCFVWSDNSVFNSNTSCFGNNEFVARSLGGFYFFTGGSSDATYTGAQLPAGAGAWSAYSDHNGKDNIELVDSLKVLQQLSAIPIATWNWKTQDASIRHMGPMAQDFRAAFGLGDSDRMISTVDSDGVALAAIQALYRLVQWKDAKIEALASELAAIKRQVGELMRDRTQMQ